MKKLRQYCPILWLIVRLVQGIVWGAVALVKGFFKMIMAIELFAKAVQTVLNVVVFPFRFTDLAGTIKEMMKTEEHIETWTDLTGDTVRQLWKGPKKIMNAE